MIGEKIYVCQRKKTFWQKPQNKLTFLQVFFELIWHYYHRYTPFIINHSLAVTVTRRNIKQEDYIYFVEVLALPFRYLGMASPKNIFSSWISSTMPLRGLNTALLYSGWTPPRNCSSLKNHFSAPNHRTYMKFFVYDSNTSKNNWEFFQVFLLLKIGRKSIKT